MCFVAQKSMHPGQPILPDAPLNVLHAAVLEDPSQHDALIALRIEIREPVFWEQPGQATRDGHASECTSSEPRWLVLPEALSRASP